MRPRNLLERHMQMLALRSLQIKSNQDSNSKKSRRDEFR